MATEFWKEVNIHSGWSLRSTRSQWISGFPPSPAFGRTVSTEVPHHDLFPDHQRTLFPHQMQPVPLPHRILYGVTTKEQFYGQR